jgi:hypothetical protein
MHPDEVAAFIQHALKILRAVRTPSRDSLVHGEVRAVQALARQWLKIPVDEFEFRTSGGVRFLITEGDKDYASLLVERLKREGAQNGGIPDEVYQLITDLGRTDEYRLANKSNNITLVPRYKSDVGNASSDDKGLEITWNRLDSGMSAYEYFQEHFGRLDYEDRPTADQVRTASKRFYSTLAQHQSRRGQSIHDLFPADPDARGGSKAKIGGTLTYDRLMERLERRRERDRLAKAQKRARLKPSADDPG